MENKAFHIITFGCQMNVRDSQWLEACLGKRGFEKKESPGEADVVILNTCSVREKPEQKVRSALGRLEHETCADTIFCVLGCVAQQMGKEIFKISSRARLVAGADGIANVPDAISCLLQNSQDRIALLEFDREYPEREPDRQHEQSAFVNIMQGCDNFCAYCIVPFTRGRQKSRKKAQILDECRMRIDEGALELTLLGQNVNAWGKDSGEACFHELLRDVASLDGLKRLCFVTPHPADMDQAIVEAFENLPVLCPRLHLPLQAGSDRILKAMRRRYNVSQYLGLVENLRKARPDIALTTDLIVGFPGETEEDFQETLAVVEASAFVSSYSFCYSDRPGTRASLMPDKIPHEISRERLLRLQALQEKLTAKWLSGRVGSRTELLLEGPSIRGNSSWQGRDPYGDIVNVPLSVIPDNPVVEAEIIEAKKHTLSGRLVLS